MTDKPKEVRLIDVADLKPYAKNAKKHEPAQINSLAASIKKYGWTQPIVVDKNFVIIIGHGRRLAAIQLGLLKVPVVVRDDLTELQVNELRLVDNRSTSMDYDMTMLQEELAELIQAGASDLDLHFSDKELQLLTDDLSDMNLAVVVDDVGAAMAEHHKANEKKVEEVDASEVPLTQAFGFKKVTVEQSRQIKHFVSKLEVQHGVSGIDALLAHIGEST